VQIRGFLDIPNQIGSDTMTAPVRNDIYLGKYQIKMIFIWANIRSIEPSQAQNQ
jgi:hypothetical protein